MATRQEVYTAIDSEREYQDSFIETDDTRYDDSLPPHTVGDYLTMLSTYLRKAQDEWTLTAGIDSSLHQIRKIAGISVHCMEDWGAPVRDLPKESE